MNLPMVRKYLNELGGLIEQVDGTAGVIDELTAIIRVADEAGERGQQMQMTQQKQQAERQLGVLTQGLLKHAKREDVEGARTLQIDLASRVDLAQNEYVKWRRLLAEFEFTVAEQQFAPEPEEGQAPTGYTRSMAEVELDKQKQRAERRVELAAALVPERVVLL